MTPLKTFFRRLFETQPSLSESDFARARKMITLDGICSMGMGTLQGGVFLTAFAIGLGAGNFEIGMIAALASITQVVQVPSLILLKNFPKRRALAFLAAGTSRLLWVFIILIPFLFVSRGITFLLLWLSLSMFVGAAAAPAWNSLLRDVIPPKRLGSVFSRRLFLGTIAALGLTLSGGFFVDWWQSAFPRHALYCFSILFALGLVLGMLGAGAIAKLPEPVMENGNGQSLLQMLAEPLKDLNFRNLLWFISIWTLAANMAGPFFAVYMLKSIGLPISTITLLTVTSQLANVCFIRIWGRAADRFSNKSVLAVCAPLFLLVILAWTFTTLPERYFLTLPLLFAIHALSGISTAGVSLSTANIALKLCPESQAHSYMTVFGLAAALFGSLAPMLGGTVSDFFASRELSLSLNWSDPGHRFSVYALHLNALDFLFVLSFLVGVYSLNRLARVREEGDVHHSEIIDHLRDELSLPLRSIASVEGLRRLTVFPISALVKLKRRGRTE